MIDNVGVTEATRPETEAETIRTHLERILTSQVMVRSESLSDFLRFVVEETLAGRGNRLKERVIACQALGREKDFDSKVDPIVRIQAGRLRRALHQYYQQEGRGALVRIELPKGTYRPVFHHAAQCVSTVASPPTAAPAPTTTIPTIAVLPFDDRGDGQSEKYFAIGLRQELVSQLTATDQLAVIAVPEVERSGSAAQLTTKLVRELGVRFVLSGTLCVAGSTIMVRMQLMNAGSGVVIWADKVRRKLTAANLFDLQEEIAASVVSTVANSYGVIPRALTSEIHGKQTDELSVYDAVLRHRYYIHSRDLESMDLARAALERAVTIDPSYAPCWAMLSEIAADTYGLRIDCRPEVIVKAKELARRAVALDPNCQQAHSSLAYAHFHARELQECLREAEITVELNPADGYLVASSAWAMAMAGQWERGLSILGNLMQQNPYYPTSFHLAPFMDHYRRGEYEAALVHANLFNMPAIAWDPIIRAAALGQLGRRQEACFAVDQLFSRFPEAAANPPHYLLGYVFQMEDVELIVAGLRKAGWQQGAKQRQPKILTLRESFACR